MWTDKRCPYLSARGCRMAAQVASLPVETCPVSTQQCADCLADHEPTPDRPNVVVGEIARAAVATHQPARLRQWSARHAIPERPQRELSEADIPCIHRGEKVGEHTCSPCRGSRTHAVHKCTLKGRECTALASDAAGADGNPVEFCITCTDRQVRARERDRRIGYLKTADGKDAGAAWSNRFAGQTVFLVCGGPSLNEMDLSILNRRGIMVAAVNNVAASHVRPQLWFSADEPLKFHQSIFADPAIACFLRGNFADRFTRRLEGTASIRGPVAREYPNIWRYETAHKENTKAADYFRFDAPFWPKDSSVRRSVMLPTLRMLVDFGFTRINLLGCDFKMEKGLACKDDGSKGSYAFDEGKDKHACETNNALFASIDAFFGNLNPILKGMGVEVRNCTMGGHMTAFERMPFAEAVDNAVAEFPKVESLFGYYWRAA